MTILSSRTKSTPIQLSAWARALSEERPRAAPPSAHGEEDLPMQLGVERSAAGRIGHGGDHADSGPGGRKRPRGPSRISRRRIPACRGARGDCQIRAYGEKLTDDLLEMLRIESVTGGRVPRWRIGSSAASRQGGIFARRKGAGSRGRWIRVGGLRCRAVPAVDAADPPRPHLVLAGHLDTVPNRRLPLRPGRRGRDRFTDEGRLGYEKAGLAVMFAAARGPFRPGSTPYRFVLRLLCRGRRSGRRETIWSNVLKAVPDLASADLGPRPRTPLTVYSNWAAAESLHLDVVLPRRPRGHSARPWLGDHPLRRAVPWVQEMLDLPYRSAVTGGGRVTGEGRLTHHDALRRDAQRPCPAHARVNLNLRYPPPDRSPRGGRKPTLVRSFPRDSAGYQAHLGRSCVSRRNPGRRADVFATLLEVTQPARARAKQAWTDVARAFWALGVPAVNWGPRRSSARPHDRGVHRGGGAGGVSRRPCCDSSAPTPLRGGTPS